MNTFCFTDEYRDAHWQKCRYGTDPRTCESAHKKRLSDPDCPTCQRDGEECDAKWKES